MKKNLIKTIAVLCFFIQGFSSIPLHGAEFTSAQTGLYSNGTTWVGGIVPAQYDDIVIATGHTVTIDADAAWYGYVYVFNITIQTGATLNNDIYNLVIDKSQVGNPKYINNGTHNGPGFLVAYDDYKTQISGNGITNCTIEIRSYGLEILSACNLIVNGNIQHSSPGNNGMNMKAFIEAWEGGGGILTINGDIITDPVYGGVTINNVTGNITVNGNVILPGSSSGGTGAILRIGGENIDWAVVNISGNLVLGPYYSYVANYGNLVIGGDLLGASEEETYFLQAIGATVKFGGQVFPDSHPGYLEPLLNENFMSAEPNTIEYNGQVEQVIENPAGGAYSNLRINNSSSPGVVLNADVTVRGLLTLTNGLLSIGNNNLILNESAVIDGTPSSTSMIVATGLGKLRKHFATSGSFTFPVGDKDGIAEYSPITLEFMSGIFFNSFVEVNLVNQSFPGIYGSYFNRYWTITSSGITGFTCNAMFDYVPADATVSENGLYCYRVLPTFDLYNAANTSLHRLSADGLTSFGTFTARHLSLNLHIILEGAYLSTSDPLMSNHLNNVLPLNQPYNIAPWNYTGTENVPSIPNANIVDWVLLEYRDAVDAASATSLTRIGRQAAFLRNDGSIVDLDGTSLLPFNYTLNNQLFIVVWHRNHLGILSSGSVSISGGTYTWDFTNGVSQAYGIDAQVELSTGIWGMKTGDANGDGVIDEYDKIIWKTQAGKEGYFQSDFGMNKQVNNIDKNDKLILHQGDQTQVPD